MGNPTKDFFALPPDVKIEAREIVSACIMEVRAGTNGPKGGDGSHGGRTVLELIDLSSFDWKVEIESHGRTVSFDWPHRVRLVAAGDCEADVLIAAMESTALILRSQMGQNAAKRGIPMGSVLMCKR